MEMSRGSSPGSLPFQEIRRRKRPKRLYGESQSPSFPEKRPGDFNQALMDLGSMVCTPRDPQCVKCPLRDECLGRASGDPERYPSRKIRKAIPHIEAVAAVIMKDGKVLVRQRAEEGLLGGLWEFPNWEVNPSAPRHKRRSLPSTRAQAEGLRVDPERRLVSPPLKAGLSAVERVKEKKDAHEAGG